MDNGQAEVDSRRGQEGSGDLRPFSSRSVDKPPMHDSVHPDPPTHYTDRHALDTTYTKVFVGGLSWNTTSETLHKHFAVYGEILEAVVIIDKLTQRSKGYGFVTYYEQEAARNATANANPVIDNRRANCNLAILGSQRPPKTRGARRFMPRDGTGYDGRGYYVTGDERFIGGAAPQSYVSYVPQMEYSQVYPSSGYYFYPPQPGPVVSYVPATGGAANATGPPKNVVYYAQQYTTDSDYYQTVHQLEAVSLDGPEDPLKPAKSIQTADNVPAGSVGDGTASQNEQTDRSAGEDNLSKGGAGADKTDAAEPGRQQPSPPNTSSAPVTQQQQQQVQQLPPLPAQKQISAGDYPKRMGDQQSPHPPRVRHLFTQPPPAQPIMSHAYFPPPMHNAAVQFASPTAAGSPMVHLPGTYSMGPGGANAFVTQETVLSHHTHTIPPPQQQQQQEGAVYPTSPAAYATPVYPVGAYQYPAYDGYGRVVSPPYAPRVLPQRMVAPLLPAMRQQQQQQQQQHQHQQMQQHHAQQQHQQQQAQQPQQQRASPATLSPPSTNNNAGERVLVVSPSVEL